MSRELVGVRGKKQHINTHKHTRVVSEVLCKNSSDYITNEETEVKMFHLDRVRSPSPR